MISLITIKILGRYCHVEKKLETCHAEKNHGQIEYFDALLAFVYDTGYPHDSRADNAPYRHDGRADYAAYPHDGRASPRRSCIRTMVVPIMPLICRTGISS